MRFALLFVLVLAVGACFGSPCFCPTGAVCACGMDTNCGPFDPPCAPGLICDPARGNTCQFPPEPDGGALCAPSTSRCDGPNVLTCNFDGTAFTVTEVCESACENGACTEPDAGTPDAGP